MYYVIPTYYKDLYKCIILITYIIRKIKFDVNYKEILKDEQLKSSH